MISGFMVNIGCCIQCFVQTIRGPKLKMLILYISEHLPRFTNLYNAEQNLSTSFSYRDNF